MLHFLVNTADHRGAVAGADPAAVLVRRVRAGPVRVRGGNWLLHDVHRRQPAAAAGHHHPAVPGVSLWDDPELPGSEHQAFIYDTYWGVIAIHVAFQIGFCAFVLSNYMKTLPHELTEAALVDGAGVWRQYWAITMPLCRPPLAALATLEFTWIYNDFFWALVLMNTGDKRPITVRPEQPARAVLHRQQPARRRLVIVAMPTLLVFLLLQKQFVGGLTLGANKG